MRLIVCCLCTDEEPFVCPFKFRRSYMTVHLGRAHKLSVKDLNLARRATDNGESATWLAVSGNSSKQVLREVEFGLSSERKASTATAQSPAWTPAAMQQLYRERDLKPV